jgi:hypothetical protein
MIEEVPQNPPLEIAVQGDIWVVEEYSGGSRSGTTFSTHNTQMDAVRTAKSKMDDDNHPCVLRWESADSVTNLYWNPDYECLEVRYDPLLEAWTVVPEVSNCAISIEESWREAFEAGKDLQGEYNFKYLRIYDRDGEIYEEREHRFLRNNLTKSGVLFESDAVEVTSEQAPEPADDSPPESEADDSTEEEDTDIAVTKPATPGMLGVSIPDVTKVEFIDTDGILHRYATPWGDGTNAQVIAIAQKYAADELIRDAFNRHLSQWEASVDSQYVASIYEQGKDPTHWVAYRAGETSVEMIGHDLTIGDRISIIESVADAIATMFESGPNVCGIRPENLRLWNVRGEWNVAVANWGIEWAVNDAIGATFVTPFTAPEQLWGELTPSTPIYQLGCVAFWLFCESDPVDADNLDQAIRDGAVRSPSTIAGVPNGVGSAIEQAMATDPDDRYQTVDEFFDDLAAPLDMSP